MTAEGTETPTGRLAPGGRRWVFWSLAALGSVTGWGIALFSVPGSLLLIGLALVSGWAGAYRQGGPRLVQRSILFAGLGLLFAYSVLLLILATSTFLQTG